MRVHMRNIIESAIERGVVTGYHHLKKSTFKTAKTDARSEAFVQTMLEHIWDSLDRIVDFSDGDGQDDDKEPSPEIGFHTVSAVGTVQEPTTDQEEETEDSDYGIPLDVLYRCK